MTAAKIIEIFELKNNPDDELDKIILEMHKRGFAVKKINVLDSEKIRKYPDILKMIKEGKEFPIIRIDGKITNKKQLMRMGNLSND